MVKEPRHRCRVAHGRVASHGFAYLAMLFAIAILGIGLLAASEIWVTTARKEKQLELEWIGAQYVAAIGRYYYASPMGARKYPNDLQELVEDKRYVTVRRHLRTLYANPLTGVRDWELIKGSDGLIRGVRAKPLSDGGDTKVFAFKPTDAGS